MLKILTLSFQGFNENKLGIAKKISNSVLAYLRNNPVGVTILNVEKNESSTTRWLLDGRQRRNALTQFYNNPENVYDWAKKYIGFSNSDQLHELEDKFWIKISEYLEDDDNLTEFGDEIESVHIDEDESDNLDESNTPDSYDKSISGLNLLLHIIKLTHNKTCNPPYFRTGIQASFQI